LPCASEVETKAARTSGSVIVAIQDFFLMIRVLI
jgi:hypothetical protein